MSTTRKFTAVVAVTGLGLAALTACGSSDSGDEGSGSKTVTLVSHDSFASPRPY